MSAAFTQYVDVAQVVLYVFWAFLAGIILYLHVEDKREGYPLESERSPNITAGRRFPPPRPISSPTVPPFRPRAPSPMTRAR